MAHTPWCAALLLAAIACQRADATRRWTQSPDSVGFRPITGAEAACATCLTLIELAVLGRDSVEGFLADDGTMDDVVRDRDGRFWVGQRTSIKIFAPDGRYLRAVGRRGQGPMEFQYAQPVQADDSGRVHVFDVRNGRDR